MATISACKSHQSVESVAVRVFHSIVESIAFHASNCMKCNTHVYLSYIFICLNILILSYLATKAGGIC